jgi:hypothetical protein
MTCKDCIHYEVCESYKEIAKAVLGLDLKLMDLYIMEAIENNDRRTDTK